MGCRTCKIAVIAFACGAMQAADVPSFEKTVAPMLTRTCAPCHNENFSSGGVDIAVFTQAASLTKSREGWDIILRKIRAGEMPPKGVPRPAEMDAAIQFLTGEFEKADRGVKPDPGRVTARRLNRSEYSNTIRDLLAVEFHAEQSFPTDDLGNGFDNIGDVLTVSPVLMERYMSAAARVASRAVGADPLPKPLEAQYANKDKKIRRVDFSTIEVHARVEFDGEYIVRFGLPGERAADAKPVTLALWMDGKLLNSMPVETKPSKLVYFDPYSEEQMRLFLPEGNHVFRAAFLDDEFVKTVAPADAYNRKKNKFIDSMVFVGPYASSAERPSRKKIFICDPKSGPVCVEKIVASLAHRAYRRPVTKAETASLMKFVGIAKANGQSTEQGIQLALQAILVSPNFLFRIEHDPRPTDSAGAHPVSQLELASRLSYFLWSSMPDDELLALAEAGKLREPGAMDAQVKRMLTDERSSAIADNFAGQWLELRNLDVVKPDPQKFPDWSPELRDAMKMESRLFFDHILRENRPLSEFLDARYSYLNERLAKHYGIAGVKGPEFRRVELDTDQRGGILSHASVLTVSSYPTRTSVVLRGQYILNNILGSPAPPPPPDVPKLDEKSVGTSASLRQQMEAHRADAMCASCHNKMDPLGFGLENYDGIGKWRTLDGKFPVDASGVMPNGKSFTTPAEMRTVLKSQLPQFSRCMVQKMLTYSLGRGLAPYDSRVVDEIDAKLAASAYGFQTLIYQIVRSLPFQSRRGEQLP
uniref:Cytochrome c domain-containing protein n=1 Tax=Solibacter usitatus (strain Ellin6076) TaxID=234267 RepID=Q01YJ6_SOLUE